MPIPQSKCCRKKNGKGLGGLPLHVEMVRRLFFLLISRLSKCSAFSMSSTYPGVLFVLSPQQNLAARRCTLSNWLMSFWRWGSHAAEACSIMGRIMVVLGNGLDFS